MAKPTRVLKSAIPSSSTNAGDRYVAKDTGEHYVWDGSSMINLGVFNTIEDADLAALKATHASVASKQLKSADGAIAIPTAQETVVIITKSGVCALTLAAPAAGTDPWVGSRRQASSRATANPRRGC